MINPIYKDIIITEDMARSEGFSYENDVELPDSDADYETDVDKIVAALRDKMELRENSIQLYYVSDTELDEGTLHGWFGSALEETERPTQGDYLRYVYKSYSFEYSSLFRDGKYYSAVGFNIEYMTTREQEEELTAKLDDVISGFSFTQDTTDVEKIKAVYDHICQNITYDHDNLYNEEYTLKFTAYAALVHGTAVCQGYATLLYRMLETVGIDARVIPGRSRGENHAWNIARIGDKYYNLDPTWDAGATDYNFLLKCNENFLDHEREEDFLSDGFQAQYPMSGEDFDLPGSSYTVYTEGDFKYQIIGGRARLIDYLGNGTDVTVPSQAGGYMVESIGTSAFEQDNTIERLTLSEGIVTMEKEAIYDCDSLAELYLPASLYIYTEDGSGPVFTGLSSMPIQCSRLRSVYVPEDSQYLSTQNGILYNKDMTALLYYPSGKEDQTFIILDGIKVIGNDSFSYSKVKKVIMPDTVTYIGSFAFRSAHDLKEINISDQCTLIGQYAFYETSIESLELPASLESIGLQSEVPDCLRSVVVDEDNPFYSSDDGVMYDKEKTEMLYCPPAKEGIYMVPDSVTYIQDGAIGSCSLSKITIPPSAAIGKDNFNSYPEQFVIHGYDGSAAQAYAQNKGIGFVSIGVMPEYEIASGNCGDGVTWKLDSRGMLMINGSGTMDFEAGPPWEDYKMNIRAVTMEGNLENIRDEAFSGCGSLVSITWPNTIKKIGKSAFWCCTQLSEVTIPEGVTEIGAEAFADCDSLANVHIPASMEKIGDHAFWSRCRTLQAITVAQGNPAYSSIDGVLFNNDKTELLQYPSGREGSYIIPEGVTSIAPRAFAYSALYSVKLPDSVARIKESAFAESSYLQEIIMGDGVTGIEEEAFFSCQSLNTIRLGEKISYIGERAFDGCYEMSRSGTIYYLGSEEEWKNVYIGNGNDALMQAKMEHKEYIPPVEHTHNFETGWSSDDEQHWKECSECGEKSEIETHDHQLIIIKATDKRNGRIENVCSVCGDVADTEVIYHPKTVMLAKTSYVYTGRGLKPAVNVKDSRGKKIPSSNYDIKYSNNKTVGKAEVKITFKGNYSGTMTRMFTIHPKKTSLTKVRAIPRGFTVKWKKQTSQTTGYEIQYSTSKGFTKKKTSVKTVAKAAAENLSVRGLKPKKAYYVRIRTYKTVKDKKYYSSWSSDLKVITARP